jgi:hypothetical protein
MTKHDVIGAGREAGHLQVADDRRIEVTGFRAPHAHGIGIYVDPVIRNATPLRSRLYRRPHPASRTRISPGCEMAVLPDAALE